MVTLLDCINRVPSVIERILKEKEDSFLPFTTAFQQKAAKWNEIVLIGSGTSNTSCITAQPFVERASGLPVKWVYPDEYIGDGFVYNPHALHVFVSQTGNSITVCRLLEKLSAEYDCTALTESPETDLGRLTSVPVSLNCGKEEYGMRTIGYAASVLNLMLLGMTVGKMRGFLSEQQYQFYIQDAALTINSHPPIVEATHQWFEENKRKIIRSACVNFTGSDVLYGVALEGAIKFWEMPQIISAGYELEEGMHGPNFGYTGNHCVIILNNGGRRSDMALSFGRYLKEVVKNGFVVGKEVAGPDDLKLDICSQYFHALEYSAFIQTFAYDLTIATGRDLTKPDDHSVMDRYFHTHAR